MLMTKRSFITRSLSGETCLVRMLPGLTGTHSLTVAGMGCVKLLRILSVVGHGAVLLQAGCIPSLH